MSTVPTGFIMDIPPELIIDILSYLPVKSLCRFKCVSKSWMTLINHPRFIKRHLAHSRKQLLAYNAHLSLVDLESSLKPISFRESKVCPIQLDQLKEKPNKRCLNVCHGSCNGLFYIKSDVDKFSYIYNPSTRECKKIRDTVPTSFRFNGRSVRSLYGFGYVESIDDYKFVGVSCRSMVRIYSLRKGLWKCVACRFNFKSPSIPGGVSLNGAIHWGGVVSYHNDSGVIIVFDLAEEKFKTLPLPIIPNSPQHRKCNIYVVGQYLCVAFETYSGFWIMKEYGVQKSWTKIVISNNPFRQYVPLCLWEKNGIIFSSDTNKRVFCYEEDGKVRKEFIFDQEYRLLPYVESLVSPNYDYELEKFMDTRTTQENLGRFII